MSASGGESSHISKYKNCDFWWFFVTKRAVSAPFGKRKGLTK